MKRRDERACGRGAGTERIAQQRRDAPAHLFGRFVGESERQDRGRLDPVLMNQIRDARGERLGLAGTGAGQDERRTRHTNHRLALYRVEIAQQIASCAAPAGYHLSGVGATGRRHRARSVRRCRLGRRVGRVRALFQRLERAQVELNRRQRRRRGRGTIAEQIVLVACRRRVAKHADRAVLAVEPLAHDHLARAHAADRFGKDRAADLLTPL